MDRYWLVCQFYPKTWLVLSQDSALSHWLTIKMGRRQVKAGMCLTMFYMMRVNIFALTVIRVHGEIILYPVPSPHWSKML